MGWSMMGTRQLSKPVALARTGSAALACTRYTKQKTPTMLALTDETENNQIDLNEQSENHMNYGKTKTCAQKHNENKTDKCTEKQQRKKQKL